MIKALRDAINRIFVQSYSQKTYAELTKKADEALDFNNLRLDLEKNRLESSLQMLKRTTDDVSVAAVNAAVALEQQLKDSEYRFFSTIDMIDDIVIVKDGSGRWKTLNKTGQLLYGWSNLEYYRKTNCELVALFPHLKEILGKCTKTDGMAWEAGHAVHIEEHIIHDNKHKILHVVKTPVYNKDGSRKELIVVARDITEMVEKQRRNRACFHAMNSVSDGIVIIDAKMHVIFSNDTFNDKFGITDYRAVINKRICDILPWMSKYSSIWATAKKNITVTFQSNEAGNIIITPMMNGKPEPIYFICTFKKTIDGTKNMAVSVKDLEGNHWGDHGDTHIHSASNMRHAGHESHDVSISSIFGEKNIADFIQHEYNEEIVWDRYYEDHPERQQGEQENKYVGEHIPKERVTDTTTPAIDCIDCRNKADDGKIISMTITQPESVKQPNPEPNPENFKD